jgi:hypothetical protein
MKIKSLFIVLAIAFLSVNCSKNCSENATPPQASVFIELIDATTEENLFTNLTYTEGDIVVKDINDEDVDFNFVSKDDLNLIQIFPSTNIATNNTVTLYMGTTETIEIQYNVETISTECYTQKKIIDVITPNYTTTVVDQIYRIKI